MFTSFRRFICLVIILFGVGARFGFSQVATNAPGPAPTVSAEGQTITLSLPDAIGLALLQNRDLLGARLSVRSATLALQNQKDRFRWRVEPAGRIGATETGEDLTYGLDVVQELQAGGSIRAGGRYGRINNEESGSYDQGEAVVQWSQPLFRSFGKEVQLEPIRSAESSARRARRSLGLRTEDMVITLVQQIEELLQTRRRITIESTALLRLEKLATLASSNEKLGKGTRIDTLRVEQELGQARLRLQNAKDLELSARQDVLDLLGLSMQSGVDFEAPPLVKMTMPTRDAAIQMAWSNRLDVAQAFDLIEDAKRAAKLSKRQLLPDLQLTARYRQFNDPEDEAWDFGEDDWFAGLSINSDLNRRAGKNAVQQGMLDQQLAELGIDDLRYQVAKQVTNAMRAYRSANGNFDISKQNVDLAFKRLELAESLYKLGKVDNFTWIDAQDDYLAAQTAHLENRASASLAGYRFLRAIGKLVDHPDSLME